MIFSIVPGFNPGNWMEFFMGFSQKLYLGFWLKPVGFYNYCPPAKASGNSQGAIHLGTPFFQNEFHKSFVINLPNPIILKVIFY